jgi:hypothetical protein
MRFARTSTSSLISGDGGKLRGSKRLPEKTPVTIKANGRKGVVVGSNPSGDRITVRYVDDQNRIQTENLRYWEIEEGE